MNHAPIDSSPVRLHQLFHEHPLLRVPEFQRTYVWRTKPNTELPRFWSDLTGLWDGEGGAPLFLGAVVLHRIAEGGFGHPTRYDIIDGQQRLLTLYLCLTAIAEAYQDAGEEGSAGDIAQQYLFLQLADFKNRPQITPAIHDSNQFNRIVTSIKHPPPRIDEIGHGDTVGTLYEAWQWIREQVRDFAKDPESETGLSTVRLELLQSKLVEQTHLVVISVFDKATAHQVFERLNKGGKRLDDIDLVRNFVFSTLAADSHGIGANFYNTQWNRFEQRLGDRAAEFWYPLALIRNPKATKAGAYTSLQHRWMDEGFTHGLTGQMLANRIMDDLREFQEPFREIAGLSDQSLLDEASALAVRRLRRANVPTMTYSFFLPLIKARRAGEIEAERFALFCEIVEAAVARRVLEGREMTAFQQAFKDLRWEDLSSEKLLRWLQEKLKLPTDDELRQGILTQNLYKMSRCRYVLTEYERWQDDGQQLAPTDTNQFHVDHVLPQKFDPKDWPGGRQEEYQNLLHTWGNLVLLPPKMNMAKSAAEYTQIRPQLSKPGGVPFRSTGTLVDEFETWTAKSIRERGEQLADWAIHRWPSTIEGFMDPERAKRLLQAK